MSAEHGSSAQRDTAASRIEHETGVRVADCYQCGKCTAGCPMAEEMDFGPQRIMRLVQLEMPKCDQTALTSRSIWFCLGCETCATRCPQEVDIPRVMDHLREEALAKGVAHPDSADIRAFHENFLKSVESHGRLFEFGFIAGYKIKTGNLFQDVMLAPSMVAKGKLAFSPHGVSDAKSIAQMFERARALKKETQR